MPYSLTASPIPFSKLLKSTPCFDDCLELRTSLIIWGFPEIGVSPNHPFKWDFPWNKPSSYGGTPMTMDTTILIPVLGRVWGVHLCHWAELQSYLQNDWLFAEGGLLRKPLRMSLSNTYRGSETARKDSSLNQKHKPFCIIVPLRDWRPWFARPFSTWTEVKVRYRGVWLCWNFNKVEDRAPLMVENRILYLISDSLGKSVKHAKEWQTMTNL